MVPAEVAPGDGWRADMLFASGISGHVELQGLATHALNSVSLNEKPKTIIQKTIARLGQDNDDVFRDARDLKEVTSSLLVARAPQLRGVSDPQDQMFKLDAIANGSAGAHSPFEPVLTRALWTVHHAGNHGSHDPHRAWEPSDLEARSLVLLTIETARRADSR